MTSLQPPTEIAYSPSALLAIFSSTLNNEATKKVFKAKGLYIPGKGENYNGLYYDELKDNSAQASMKLLVPAVIRSQLKPNETIEFYAFLLKKLQSASGRIDLQLQITELLSVDAATYSEKQVKSFEILERKASSDRKDIDSFIKAKIVNGESITVNIIIGKTAIIDEDIKHQLQEAIGFYRFHYIRINLTSIKEIIQNLTHYSRKCDIVAIARGGGENLEIFDEPEIAEAALLINTRFVTALGHKDNVPLLQRIADKAFITPTAFGQYFNDIYNNTVAELQGSKAKMVEMITKQLEGNYQKQIENLNSHITGLEKSTQKEVAILSQQLNATKEEKMALRNTNANLQAKLKKTKKQTVIMVMFILFALILGYILGTHALSSHNIGRRVW